MSRIVQMPGIHATEHSNGDHMLWLNSSFCAVVTHPPRPFFFKGGIYSLYYVTAHLASDMPMAESLFFGVFSFRGRRALRNDRIGQGAGLAAPNNFLGTRTNCRAT